MPEAVGKSLVKPNRPVFEFEAGRVRELFEGLLRERGPEGFYLSTLVAVDLPDRGSIRLDYCVVLLPEEVTVIYRTHIPRDKAEIDSVVDLVPGAFSAEMEVFDLMGVVFRGNRSLKRGFFVPPEVAGGDHFPLRKR